MKEDLGVTDLGATVSPDLVWAVVSSREVWIHSRQERLEQEDFET